MRKWNQRVVNTFTDPLLRWMYISLFMIERDAAKLAPADTGRLRNAIRVEVDEKHLIGYVGVFGGGSGSVLKYAKYIEFGTRKHFLPFDPMKYPGFVRWAIRKGLYKKGGGLIVGGYATPFMHFALAKNQPKIQASLRAIRGAV